MKSFNQAIIVGHVAAEPEIKPVRAKDGDVKVAKFTVATSTGGYTKKDGTQVPENTQFHRVVAWRGDAEYVEKYIHKGDAVTITGEINYSEMVIGHDGKPTKDMNAQGVKVRYTDIVADEIILCHSKNGIHQSQPQPMQNGQPRWQQPYPLQPYPQQPWQHPIPQYPQGYNPHNNGNAPC